MSAFKVMYLDQREIDLLKLILKQAINNSESRDRSEFSDEENNTLDRVMKEVKYLKNYTTTLSNQ